MKLCIRCSGTGRYLGNGMMMADCTLCDDDGVVDSAATLKPKLAIKLDRRSASYKKAIEDIMASNDKLTKKEAVKLFDDAYNRDS